MTRKTERGLRECALTKHMRVYGSSDILRGDEIYYSIMQEH